LFEKGRKITNIVKNKDKKYEIRNKEYEYHNKQPQGGIIMSDVSIFNAEATISTPAIDIVRVLVLQRCDNAIESIELHRRKSADGINFSTAEASARVNSLFLLIRNVLERRLKPEHYNILKDNIKSEDIDKILKAFEVMLDALDQIRLTRLDTGKQIDTTSVEDENNESGL